MYNIIIHGLYFYLTSCNDELQMTKNHFNLKVIRHKMSTIPAAITFIYCKYDLLSDAAVNFKWQPQN